jgi:hypothetical protein
MPVYTKEDGRALSKEELLRLLVLANGYEMVWCMEECVQALQPFDGYDEALAFFGHVPDSLLWTEHLHAATKAAGDALAKALGPVEELWQAAEAYDDSVDWMVCYVLDERVTALPIGAIEAVLRSEELQLKSENYSFSLALWWIMRQKGTVGEQQPLFNRLLKSLRYARMSAVFLASIASFAGVQNTGLLPSIMRRGLWRRDDVPSAYGFRLPASRVKEADRESYRCTFTAHFTKAAIEALREPGGSVYAALGLLNGFPCFLRLWLAEEKLLELCLFSEFVIEDTALDTPGKPKWGGTDLDVWRSFEYTVVRGTVGAIDLEPNLACVTRVNGASRILKCSPDALVYDTEGKLQVEIELNIDQHKNC